MQTSRRSPAGTQFQLAPARITSSGPSGEDVAGPCSGQKHGDHSGPIPENPLRKPRIPHPVVVCRKLWQTDCPPVLRFQKQETVFPPAFVSRNMQLKVQREHQSPDTVRLEHPAGSRGAAGFPGHFPPSAGGWLQNPAPVSPGDLL